MPGGRVDGLTLVALALIAFMGLNLFLDYEGSSAQALQPGDITVQLDLEAASQGGVEEDSPENQQPDDEETQSEPEKPNQKAFRAPYDSYTLTQGLHGYSYGHAAIDIAAGKGAKIKSPINGEAVDLFVDQYGNTTLILENDRWRVTMLHGDYSVEIGETVEIGQKVGTESNHGYTTDMQGRPCWNRECGYHTHLNVFDKNKGENANPLDLID